MRKKKIQKVVKYEVDIGYKTDFSERRRQKKRRRDEKGLYQFFVNFNLSEFFPCVFVSTFFTNAELLVNDSLLYN